MQDLNLTSQPQNEEFNKKTFQKHLFFLKIQDIKQQQRNSPDVFFDNFTLNTLSPDHSNKLHLRKSIQQKERTNSKVAPKKEQFYKRFTL